MEKWTDWINFKREDNTFREFLIVPGASVYLCLDTGYLRFCSW